MLVYPNGRPAVSQQTVPMTRADVKRFQDLEVWLKHMGLSLYCEKCHHLGLPDGVQGNNRDTDATLVVSCGCTQRVYRQDTN